MKIKIIFIFLLAKCGTETSKTLSPFSNLDSVKHESVKESDEDRSSGATVKSPFSNIK